LEYIILVGAIILVLVTGLIKVRRATNTLILDHNFVNDFRTKFLEFTSPLLEQQQQFTFSSRSPVSLDAQLYHWLVSHMDKTQRLLGLFGIAHYSGPFNRIQVPNYHYIINTIPQIRMGEAQHMDLLTCDDMMVRYLGSMSRSIEEEEKRLKNPLTWLQEGIQFYIGFPIRVLKWFGIISDTSFEKIVSSRAFQVLAGIGGLVGFIASIVTILQGWPTLKDLLK
jgi:hypothetical protein